MSVRASSTAFELNPRTTWSKERNVFWSLNAEDVRLLRISSPPPVTLLTCVGAAGNPTTDFSTAEIRFAAQRSPFRRIWIPGQLHHDCSCKCELRSPQRLRAYGDLLGEYLVCAHDTVGKFGPRHRGRRREMNRVCLMLLYISVFLSQRTVPRLRKVVQIMKSQWN
ncbi:hypothetical protein F2P81_001739 [Scophthalmus maximus]|uniref:Uncharacterized protein n=1 Tax=Scophthalmus maximus TaxID=52904 RepID=A0A6A4TNU4_SCOMX|nr:hypothetical protein F2P81_001739 [Scophthalmus maximus]